MPNARPLSDSEYALLTAAHEDLNGLWEAVWGLRTLNGGSGEDEALRQQAEPILRSFLDQGWLELQRHRSTSGDSEPIDTDQARQLLADPSVWQPPPSVDAPYVGFVATPAGDEAWNAASAARHVS